MKRAGVLIGLSLALAACGGASATVPATHARLAGNQGSLDVWRDQDGRLTFHWISDNAGEGFRYDPSTHVFAQLADGQVLFSTTYPSSRMGWRAIRTLYGVDEQAVTAGLASGRPSAEFVDYTVAAPRQQKAAANDFGFTDYGTDLAGVAQDTGLVIPKLGTLGGQPLMDASVDRERTTGHRIWAESARQPCDRAGHHEAPPDDAGRWKATRVPVPRRRVDNGVATQAPLTEQCDGADPRDPGSSDYRLEV